MKKRILSLVLALSMMISLFPVSALAQTPGGGEWGDGRNCRNHYN